ncbi:MAG: hypothetical protein ACI8YI_002468 [Paracoccaceae bacterium]|jgi:hypothetical protein|tara:strand:+ start:155 stop:349 length:195 start_codon:yes stop_codon:yes gene_type:complete
MEPAIKGNIKHALASKEDYGSQYELKLKIVVASELASATGFEAELKYLKRSTQDRWQPISIHLN